MNKKRMEKRFEDEFPYLCREGYQWISGSDSNDLLRFIQSEIDLAVKEAVDGERKQKVSD